MIQNRLRWGLIAWGLGTMPATWAHGVDIQYQVVPSYRITATYDGGQPMAKAQVSIFAPNQPAQPWLQGQTDVQGQFTFTPFQPGNWEVRVRQAGHGQLHIISVPSPESAQRKASSPDSVISPGPNRLASSPGLLHGLHGGQRALVLGSVVWGCIGTALFFSRSRRESANNAPT